MVVRHVILGIGVVFLGEQGGARANEVADSRITISHSGCRGTCAIYDVTLFPSGLVLYNGVKHVKTIGKAQTQIQPSTYKAFLVELDRLNFFSLGECALTIDAPGTTTTVAVQGKRKTVHHTGGCITESKVDATGNSRRWIELTDLETRIEASVNSSQWTK